MTYCWLSPVGFLQLEEKNGCLTRLELTTASYPENDETPLLSAARQQLDEYFAGSRKIFSLPLCPVGTAFQLTVWKALQTIPYGGTCSYGDLARQIGRPQAARAVGGAIHRNPLLILIPCHRVIGANGSLVGFGAGLPVKRRLLQLEQKFR